MKVTITDNPIANRRRRYWQLERRYLKISRMCTYPCTLCPAKKKMKRLQSLIRAGQKPIAEYLRKNGYTLA
jgi:hypothetical protein